MKTLSKSQYKTRTENAPLLSEEEFTLKPYEHQKRITSHLVNLIEKGATGEGLFVEMGLGKTKIAIDTFTIAKQRGLATRMLVICPRMLCDNWVDEVYKNTKGSVSVADAYKNASARRKAVRGLSSVIVMSYAGFIQNIKDGVSFALNKFDFIVLDESHSIKNPQAQRTKALLSYAQTFWKNAFKLILTGTPVMNNPVDLYTQFAFLERDGRGFGYSSFYSFRNSHCKMGGYLNKEIIGYKDLDKIKKQASLKSIQLTKEECFDLPEKSYTQIKCQMDKELRRQYDEMKKTLSIIADSGEEITAMNALVQVGRLSQILSGAFSKEVTPKMKAVIDYAKDAIEQGEQVVIFTVYRQATEQIASLLESEGVPVTYIHGGVKERHERVLSFQKGEVKILVGTVASCSTGINLTAGRIALFFENSYKMVDRIQAEARTHRIGQKNACMYVDFIYDNTVDEKIIKAIQGKEDIAASLIKSFKARNL